MDDGLYKTAASGGIQLELPECFVPRLNLTIASIMNLTSRILLAAAALAAGSIGSQAQVFTYSSGGATGVDTVFSVRGRNPLDSNDYGANLGNVEQFLSSSTTVLDLQVVDPADLIATFGDLTELSFSVGAGAGSASGSIATGTVFITKPRNVAPGFDADVISGSNPLGGTPFASPSSTAPTSAGIITQGTLRNRVVGVGLQLSTLVATVVDDQVATIADSDGSSYTSLVGVSGNYGVAQTQGTVEGSTGTAAPADKIYLDFYRLNPAAGSANVSYLGAFEFSTDGSLEWYRREFIAVPEPGAYAAAGAAGLLGFALFRRTRSRRS